MGLCFFDFAQGDYRFFACEGFGFVLQGRINFVYLIGWFAALPYNDLLVILVIHGGSDHLLCIHYSHYISPFVFDAFLL